jgi:FlaG/FlaF family flagellin (archaellin)
MGNRLSSNDGVSEVIGTVLTVAIVVAVGAFAAVYVLSLPESIQNPKIIAVTVLRVNESHGMIDYFGGQGQGSVLSLNWSVNMAPFDEDNSTAYPALSDKLSFSGLRPGLNRMVVKAQFIDGSEQILFDGLV